MFRLSGELPSRKDVLMKKLILTMAAALVMSLGLVSATPAPSRADSGCVTLREARDTLKYDPQGRSGIHRGFGTRGVKVREWSTRKAQFRTYRPCVGENSGYTYVDVVYVRKNGRWQTIYWAWALRRGEGDNRVRSGRWSSHS